MLQGQEDTDLVVTDDLSSQVLLYNLWFIAEYDMDDTPLADCCGVL